MTNDFISIITPTYNSSLYIAETIESVINQSYKEFELILVDDCSNDNTVDIIKSYITKDNRIKLIENKINSGAAFSRNIAIAKSNHNYLAFIDSDDVWDRNKLAKQLLFMKNKKVCFSFTAFEIIDSNSKSNGRTVDTKQNGSFSYDDMLVKKATLGCSTVILYKKAFTGLLEMPSIRTGQDYAFWLKLLKNTDEKAFILPLPLTKYRITPNSISRNKINKAKRQWFIYREIEQLSLLKSCYCFCFYAFRAIFKKK